MLLIVDVSISLSYFADQRAEFICGLEENVSSFYFFSQKKIYYPSACIVVEVDFKSGILTKLYALFSIGLFLVSEYKFHTFLA